MNLMSVTSRGESQEACPSGVSAADGAVREQTVETRIWNVVEKGGGEEELQRSPSLEWSEFDVAEVLCGIYGETALGKAESTGGEGELPSVMKTERYTVGPEKGQGLRRRKFCEDVAGDQERKCSKVQEPVFRQAQSQEDVGELDTGERVVGENGV